jgi:hypothetical protein
MVKGAACTVNVVVGLTRPDSILHVPQLFFGVTAMGRLLIDQASADSAANFCSCTRANWLRDLGSN